MQFNIARDERSDKLCIRRRASATASDRLADIVNLCFGSPISYALVDRPAWLAVPFRSSYPQQ
jgi:hypothetical protein